MGRRRSDGDSDQCDPSATDYGATGRRLFENPNVPGNRQHDHQESDPSKIAGDFEGHVQF